MCDYVGKQRAGACFFAMRIQETWAGWCKIQYMLMPALHLFHFLYIFQQTRGKGRDGTAICHHRNNVRTAAGYQQTIFCQLVFIVQNLCLKKMPLNDWW